MEMDEIINITRAREFARSFLFLFFISFCLRAEGGRALRFVEWANIAGDLRENQIYMLRWCYDTAKWEFDL